MRDVSLARIGLARRPLHRRLDEADLREARDVLEAVERDPGADPPVLRRAVLDRAPELPDPVENEVGDGRVDVDESRAGLVDLDRAPHRRNSLRFGLSASGAGRPEEARGDLLLLGG